MLHMTEIDSVGFVTGDYDGPAVTVPPLIAALRQMAALTTASSPYGGLRWADYAAATTAETEVASAAAAIHSEMLCLVHADDPRRIAYEMAVGYARDYWRWDTLDCCGAVADPGRLARIAEDFQRGLEEAS